MESGEGVVVDDEEVAVELQQLHPLHEYSDIFRQPIF
jgi:hypothetical protein